MWGEPGGYHGYCADRRQGAATGYLAPMVIVSRPLPSLWRCSDQFRPADPGGALQSGLHANWPLLVTVRRNRSPHPYGGQDMQVMVNLDQPKAACPQSDAGRYSQCPHAAVSGAAVR